MIETEKKYFLTSEQHRELQNVLSSYAVDEYLEENILYNISKPYVLRLRKLKSISGQSNIIATYKGRADVDETGIKSRKEVEFSTQSSTIFDFIEALNYRKSLVYEKRRRDHHYRGATVSLDELPFGFYMEIEGTPLQIKDIEFELLGSYPDVEKYSYPDLTHIYGKNVEGILESRFLG